MVRPAGAPTNGPVGVVDEPAIVEEDGAGTRVTIEGGGPPVAQADAETARVAEARVRADPLAQQHQLRIQAKLDARVDRETATRVVRFGHRVAHQIYDEGSATAAHAMQSLEAASRLSGQRRLVTTGTIERSGDRFVYSPEPRDRLVVPGEDGGTRTYRFDKIEGNLSSVEAYFQNDHDFRFSVEEGEGERLDITSTKDGHQHDVTVKGNVVFEGETFQADIRYRGNEVHEGDSTGSTYTSTATYSGTVRGEGMVLTVEETQRYQQVHAVRTEGFGGSAVSRTREINNRLEVGDDTYRWQGVRTHQTFRNGYANNANGEWAAAGQLFHNDALLGTYRLGSTGNIIAFQLDLGTEQVEIDRFQRR